MAASLTNYLERWKKTGQKPAPGKQQALTMKAEVETVKFWIKSMDLKFENEGEAGSKVNQLKAHIRQRMLAFFNLPET